jgi:heptosyltransferase-2
MHLASAIDVPIVAIFGSTDWIRTPPWSNKATIVRKQIHCAPCMLRDCPHEHECMTAIEVTDVLDAVEKQLRIAESHGPAKGK